MRTISFVLALCLVALSLVSAVAVTVPIRRIRPGSSSNSRSLVQLDAVTETEFDASVDIVNSVGVQAALKVLAGLTPEQLAAALEAADIDVAAIYASYRQLKPVVGQDGRRAIKKSRSLIEASTSDSVEMNNGALIGAYPGLPLSAVAAAGHISANAARLQIRGGISDFASGIEHLYTKDFAGRVTKAKFDVDNGSASSPGPLAEKWCDVAWNPSRANGLFYNQGEINSRIALEYNAGHIIAAFLGGSNTDPLNFFPHHARSNQWGRFNRAELIAADVRAYLITRGSRSAVTVEITLAYANPAQPFVPTGGTYTISISNHAWNQHFNVATAPVAPTFAAWAARFAARSVPAPAPAARRHLIVNWRNQGDMPIPALPNAAPGAALASAFNGNEFVVDISTL